MIIDNFKVYYCGYLRPIESAARSGWHRIVCGSENQSIQPSQTASKFSLAISCKFVPIARSKTQRFKVFGISHLLKSQFQGFCSGNTEFFSCDFFVGANLLNSAIGV